MTFCGALPVPTECQPTTVSVEFRVDAVVFGNDDSESAEDVFQNGETLF